jgi:hypothetical protein
MPRTCSICTHPERAAIEAAIVAGTPIRDIALRQHVGVMAVQRHKAEHIPASIAQAQEAREEAQALDVVRQLKAINAATLSILSEARKARDHDTALKAIDRIQRQIELQAKLLGEIDDRPQVNVLLAPEWVTVRAVLMRALAPHSEARADVAAALLHLEDGRGGVSNGHRK